MDSKLEMKVVDMKNAGETLAKIQKETSLGTHQIYWIYGKHGIHIESVKKLRKIGSDGRGRPKIGIALSKFLGTMEISRDEIQGYEYMVTPTKGKLVLTFVKK